jgi:hypothetical protein
MHNARQKTPDQHNRPPGDLAHLDGANHVNLNESISQKNLPVPFRPADLAAHHGGVGDQCPAGCLVYRPADVAPSGGDRCPQHINLPLVPAAVGLS